MLVNQGSEQGAGAALARDADGLLAVLAHELLTPLTPITGFAELLLERFSDQLGPDARKMVTIMQQQSHRLERRVGRIIETGRSMAGRVAVAGPVQLAAVVEAVLVRRPVVLAGIEPQVLPSLWVSGDARELELMVEHLLINAATYGAGPIACRASAVDDRVELTVQDGGGGMRGRLLGAAGSSSTAARDPRGAEGGLGLGLRLVAGLAERADGTLRLDSPPDGGVVIVISLRAALPVVVDLPEDELGVEPAPSADGADLSVGDASWAPAGYGLEIDLPDDASTRPLPVTTAVEMLWVGAVEPLREELARRMARGESASTIVTEMLVPVLEGIGDRWESGSWSVADQKASSSLFGLLVSELELRARSSRGTGALVTIVGAVDERHELPSRLLSLQLLELGCRVRWLGADVPVSDLARDLRSHRPDVLFAFCHFAPLLGRLTDTVAASHRAGIPVVVGGQAAIAHPDVAAAVGAEMVALSARQAVEAIAGLRVAAQQEPAPPWDRIFRPVKRSLGPLLPTDAEAALTEDELRWLAEAVAVARWAPHGRGQVLLDEHLAVLGLSLRLRSASPRVLAAVAGVAHEVASAPSALLARPAIG